MHRIIDANLNRAGEGLRVLEEHARLMLDDAPLTQRIKQVRHNLACLRKEFGLNRLLAERDIEGDVGTAIATESERRRSDSVDVALAAARRAAEALRCVEEYGKVVNVEAAGRIGAMRYDLYRIEQDCMIASPRRQRLRRARLHVLVTEALCPGPWWSACESAIAGGADVIQLREKQIGDGELLRRAERLRELTRQHDALLVINDRPDIARLVGADGVHVGQEDLSVAHARRIAGPAALVGKSTHSVEQLDSALAEHPDYVAVGPMFASATKPNAVVAGPALLHEAAHRARGLPIVAIGGITPANVSRLGGERNWQVAACQSVIAAEDVEVAAKALRAALP